MAEKYCKCGHNRQLHRKNPTSIFSFPNFCRSCPCSEYMNNKLPNIISKITFILGIIVLSTFIVLTILILSAVYLASFTIEWAEQVKNVTMGEYLTILSLFLIIVCFVLYNTLSTVLFGFLEERKRKNHPEVK